MVVKLWALWKRMRRGSNRGENCGETVLSTFSGHTGVKKVNVAKVNVKKVNIQKVEVKKGNVKNMRNEHKNAKC